MLFDTTPENLRKLDADAGFMEESKAEENTKPNFAPNDEITLELQSLYTNFQKCLDLREKYMKVSCQRVGDNPIDKDDWVIYPPPPPPSWPVTENKGRVTDGPDSIGSDFIREDCKIPGPCDFVYEMDDTGVYQVITSSCCSLAREPCV
jgi:AMP deaminase